MRITKEEQLKSIEERINQYSSLIFRTVFDISELLEKRKELKNEKEEK